MNSDTSLNAGEIVLEPYDSPEKGNKRCYICRKLLPKSEFHKNKNRPGGLTNECKTCASIRQKRLYTGIRRLRIQYNAIERRAKKSNTSFHITFNEFRKWDEQFGKHESRICPYCRLTEVESKHFQRLRGKRRICGFTVDRIDNEKGYTMDNIQRICFLCNSIKGLWFRDQDMLVLGPVIRKIQQTALSAV